MNETLMPLIAVVLGMTVSFIGTLPPGVISITVMDTAGRKSLRDGLIVAGAASFVEFFQATAALLFSSLIATSPIMQQIIKYGAIPLFILFGLYNVLKKSSAHIPAERQTSSHTRNIAKGLFVGATNVLVIPFWIFWSAYCASNGWINYKLPTVLCFAAGVTAGTFLALALYAKLGKTITSRSNLMEKWGKKVLGVVFIGIGVYQLVRVLMER